MTFSPLETALITIVGAIVVGLFVRVRSVSESHCKTQHDKVNGDLRTIFSMLRAIVTYMEGIPKEERVKILNEKGDG